MHHKKPAADGAPLPGAAWDHSSHEEFYNYYAEASQSEQALQRFGSVCDVLLRVHGRGEPVSSPLEVAEIGCGAGTMCMMWAERGHHAHGLDVNEPLLDLARQRAAKAGYSIDFQVGSATSLCWPDHSMDICIALELLEHVAEWQACLHEFIRILRPGGILCLTTTNKLCPVQHEFTLPLYSWYPGPLKRYYEQCAVTTRPELANFAKYPAVNWFSFYSLRAVLSARGFQCMDRFDAMDTARKGRLAQGVVTAIRAVPALRWLAHVATPGTMILAIKHDRALA